MVFLPGEHTLQDDITVRGIGGVAFIGNSTDVSKVICTGATVTFTNILKVEIADLGFHFCTIQLDISSAVFKNSSFKNSTSDYGGAIYAHKSTISFEGQTQFEGNKAAVFGGGIFAEESNLTFHGNTTFINNEAIERGGGIYMIQSDFKFVGNASFIANIVIDRKLTYFTQFGGGGIRGYNSRLDFDFDFDFENTFIFLDNSAVIGGGLQVEYSTVSFSGVSQFINNSALWGGGVYVSGSNVSFGSDSSFTNNSAVVGHSGGIYVLLSNVSFGDDGSFTNNSALRGGAVIVDGSNVSFGDYNTFINNSAGEYGGGVLAFNSIVSFGDNSGFINNSGEYDGGGGVYVSGSNVSFGDNSTFISNSADYGGGGLYIVLGSSVSFSDDNSFINNLAAIGGGVYVSGSNVSFGSDSSFTNNSSWYGGGVYVEGSNVNFGDDSSFINNSVGGKYGIGGGVCVLGSNVNFGDNSGFINNSAKHGSGGVNVEGSNVSFGDDSSFINNSAGDGGGGGVYIKESTVSFGDSDFTGNLAAFGGGVYVEESHVSFGDDDFTGNSADHFGGCMAAKESTIDICGSSDFMNNSARYGGCIFLDTCKLTFSKATIFSWNSVNTHTQYSGGSGDVHDARYGGALLALSSDLTFGGSHELANNSAGYGGAIYLTLDSKIYLLPNTTTSFEKNHAQYRGGALFVDANPFTYCIFDEDVQTNIRDGCFIQMHMFEAGCVPFITEDNPSFLDPTIQLLFQDNSANEAGSILYGGNLYSCGVCIGYLDRDWYVSGEVAFNAWANVSSNLMSSDPYRLCVCVDNHPDCSQSNTTREVFPGATIGIPVVALGQYDGAVPAVIQTYTSERTRLGPLQHTQWSNNTCTNLQYTVGPTIGNSTWNEATLTLYTDEPCSTLGFPLEVFVTFLPCPLGFSLSTEGSCECDQRLNEYEVYCDINDQSILRKDSVWIGFNEQSDNKSQGLILHPHCPFDYCITETDSVNFTMNNKDLQCNYNRSGHLCGACQHGFSLAVGSSRCLPCSNKFLALLLPFVIAGLGLVIFLFVCKVTVAAGTISGLIFYANIVTVNQSIFFPSGETNILTVFIAWLNLDLGIETCFFDGMDAYSMTWLQFVFPIYIWLLVGLIAILCNYSTTAARILGSTNPIAVLATLFLLSYTKLLRTVIAAFSFTTLEYPDEIKVVWLYDGNIGYLDKNDGRHIALFLASLLVFLFLFLPYTLFLLLGQCILPRLDPTKLRCLSWANYLKMKSFLDAHHAPYKDRHRYWIGLLLVLRFILFLISAIVDMESPQDPHVNLLVIIISTVVLAIFAWNVGGGMYKKWYLNALESSFIFNLIILAAATYQTKLAGGNQAAVFYTSVTIAFTTFIGIIIYHVYQRLRDSRAWRNLVRKHNERRRARDHGWQREDAAEDEEMEEMIPQAAPTVSYVDIPAEERRKMRPITPPQSLVNSNIREQLNHLQREDAATDEEMEEMLPQAAPTVTYVDIPADERRQMRPITPPLSPVNLTDVHEHWQREDAAADDHEEVEREVPQVTPTVTYIPAIPAAKAMHPPINFTDLREPLDLLTQ